MLPGHAAVLNPVDLAGGAEQDVHTFERVARVLLESGEVDALLITGYFGGYGEYGAELAAEERVVAARLGELAQRLRMPILVHAMYNDSEAARMLRVSGVPTYRTIDQAVRGAARLLRRREPRERIPALPPPARQLERHDYSAAHELLRSVGVPMVDQRTVTGPEQAVQAAAELGYPVVLKALGALHKSDRGGVVLGLSDEGQLRQAFAALAGRLGAEAYSVEAMAPLSQGVELLIGSRWDARFGPVAVVASGGLHTETLSDAAVALAPVSEAEAEAMVRSLRIAPILSGARGRLAARVDAAARALAALSRLAAAHPAVREIEVNPLLVTPTGAIGLDARIVPGDAHA
jgi:acyl-CoA synthetase (NDP forming)